MQHLLKFPARRVIALVALLALLVTVIGAASASAAITPGKYRITTGATGFSNVLDAAGDIVELGTPVINWPFNGGNNQEWYINKTSGAPGGTPLYSLSSVRNPDFCLDVSGASSADGALVGLWSCHFGFNQQFFYRENANKTGSFIARHSGKALTMPFEIGRQMFQHGDTNSSAQQFQFHRLD